MTRFLSSPLQAGCRSAIVAFVALALSACANDYTRVADSLTATDLALIAQTTQRALEDSRVGISSNWSNEDNGHLGTVTPTRTYTSDSGTPCRAYQQTATVEGRTIFAYDRACRGGDGQWRSTNYGSLAQAIRKGESRYAYARRPYPGYYYDDPFCRWPYRDPFCSPYYGSSVGLGFSFGL